MVRIGFTTVTFRKHTRRQICEIARENGIEYLEWGGDVHLPPGDETATKEVIELQKEFGIKANSYGSYYRLGANDEKLWADTLKTASAIGAKTIRIWMGNTEPQDTTQEVFDAMVKETQMLCDMAKEYDIKVAFEFHHKTYNLSGDASLKFLKAVDRENVRTYWQPLTEPQDEENLKAVLPYLDCVHVFQWRHNGYRFPLWRGKRVWKRFLDIAMQAPETPIFILEFVKHDNPKQFKKDVVTLKKWLAAY